MEFLAERLDPGNCFTAMALGLHLSESAAGRELHDRSVAFMCGSFGPVVCWCRTRLLLRRRRRRWRR